MVGWIVGDKQLGASLFATDQECRGAAALALPKPWLRLKGVSTGRFEEALTVLLDPKAGGHSPTTIRRLVEVWQREHTRWQGRDLSAKRNVHAGADGRCESVVEVATSGKAG